MIKHYTATSVDWRKLVSLSVMVPFPIDMTKISHYSVCFPFNIFNYLFLENNPGFWRIYDSSELTKFKEQKCLLYYKK